ncbi:hypothetical protein JZ751_027131 [Albula glossodonta]|uniref:Serine/arginine-rich splicing factor 7 n=1 Tax=Albula glossodonta TaxID=121402 RepID=A0A8T2NCG8_9TELE|nr:hypothetical protein JZ751_027131 [Albula glossodonta]
MSRYGRYGGETKVYVGNLGTGAGKGELERAFGYYGPLRTVWIARNPPGFAFVEFEDPRDAEDAVRGLDGKVICGSRVRVELSTGMPRRSRYDRPPTRRPFDPNDRCYECGEKGHYAYDCHRYSRRRRSRKRARHLMIANNTPPSPPINLGYQFGPRFIKRNDPGRPQSSPRLEKPPIKPQSSDLAVSAIIVPLQIALSIPGEEVLSLPQPQPKQEIEILFSSQISLQFTKAVALHNTQEVQVGLSWQVQVWISSQEPFPFRKSS